MTVRNELIGGALTSLDAQFASSGFKRRRVAQDWRGQLPSGHTVCLHLNFGKNTDPLLATVSVGIAHPALEALLQEAGYRTQGTDRSLTYGRTLGTFESHTTGREARAADIGARVWALWIQEGQPFLRAASDLTAMASALRSSDPQAWPCPSRSHRARLLPVTLWALGQHAQAIRELPWLAEDIADTDVLRPSFADFSKWLHNKASSAV